MNIQLVMIDHKGGRTDITDMVTDIGWSGDVNSLPRTLEVSLVQSLNSDGSKTYSYDVGYMVIFYYEEKEIFRGVIFKRSIDQSGKDSFTAYDELIYATKNYDSIIIKDKTASEVITEHLEKFGIQLGSIQPTEYKIEKLVQQNKTLADIWEECLIYERANTGKNFTFFCDKGYVYSWSREKAAVKTISLDDVISGSNEVSMEDLRTQVLVYKGSFEPQEAEYKQDGTPTQETLDEIPYQTELVEDNSAAKKYGIMQHIEEAWDSATSSDMRNIGNTILAGLNEPTVTASIEFIGNIECITGKKIEVEDKMTGIKGEYYITSDSHTISNGVHKMSLQLSKKLE